MRPSRMSGCGPRSGSGTRRNALPWNRARIHWEFLRRQAFVRWPVHGNVLEALRAGRLEIGPHVLFEPGVWITMPAPARIRIGGGSFLNLGVMIAASELVEIGEHCMFANGCFVTDASHRFDDPDPARPLAGLHEQGPDPDRRQRVVRRARRRHERGHDRPPLRHRRQLRRHEGHPAVLDRRRRPGEGDRPGRLPGRRRGRRSRTTPFGPRPTLSAGAAGTTRPLPGEPAAALARQPFEPDGDRQVERPGEPQPGPRAGSRQGRRA